MGNLGGGWMQTIINNVLAIFNEKEKVTRSQPHSENERQRIVNDF